MADKTIAIRLAVLDGGKVKTELRDVGEQGDRSLSRIEDAGQRASLGLKALDTVASRVGPALAGYFAIDRLVAFGTTVVDTTARVQDLTVRLTTLTGSAQAAADAQAFLHRTAGDLHAAVETLADGYTSLLPLVNAQVLSTEQARTLLIGYRNAAAATGASNEQLKQSMYGLAQGLSAGTLRAEELNQVTEAMPGLLQALDKAAGLAAGGFRTLVTDGHVTSEMVRDVLIVALRDYEGAAARTADTLSAKFADLGNASDRLLVTLGQPIAAPLGAFLDEVTLQVDRLGSAIDQMTTAALEVESASLRAKLQAAEHPLPTGIPGLPTTTSVDALLSVFGFGTDPDSRRQRLTEIDEELVRRTLEKRQTQTSTGPHITIGLPYDLQARSDLLKTRQRIDDSLSGVLTPVEQIAKVNAELVKTKATLDSLRGKKGIADADLDLEGRRAEEAAARRIREIQDRGNRSRPSGTTGSTTRAARDPDAELVTSLRQELDLVGATERARSVATATRRLSATATDAERAEVARLAGALWDSRHAEQAATEAKAEGARITRSLLTPQQHYAAEIDRLSQLQRQGVLDAATFSRGQQAAYREMLDAATDWRSGLQRAWLDYRDSALDAAHSAEQGFESAMRGMEDALVQFVTTGELSFSTFADAILEDITRLAFRQAVVGVVGESGGGLLDSLLGGIGSLVGGGALSGGVDTLAFHDGGEVGSTLGPCRTLPAWLWDGARRFHDGTLPGLAPDEVPAILQRGEVVLSRQQVRGAANPAPVQVTMNITTPDAGAFRRTQAQIAAEAARAISRAQLR